MKRAVVLEACLECGEPVHPVAGRCKHCRADLALLRTEAKAAEKRASAAARAAVATPLRVSTAAERDRAGEPTLQPRNASARASTKSSSFSSTRRLALAVAAVLLVGVVGGVVAQQVYARGKAGPDAAPAVRHAAADPTSNGAHDPGDSPGSRRWNPFGLPPTSRDPDPLDPFAGDPADPLGGGGLDPFSFLNPRGPSARKPRALAGPLPDVSDVQRFVPGMVEVACDKLAQCGLVDDAMVEMCKMLASGLQDFEVIERVQRGECRYDAGAARECLQAVGGMTCDSAVDPGQLLALADQVASCSRTLDCP